MGHVDAQAARRLAAQVVTAHRRLPQTGFPQDSNGAAALRASALAEVLGAIADEAKATGLTADGTVPPDIALLDELRHLIDRTIADLVRSGAGR